MESDGFAKLPDIRIVMSQSGEWIVRGVDDSAADAFLKRHQPWRMELKFDNGPKASDGPTFEPFNKSPLNKLRRLLEQIPQFDPHGASVLDVGFNAGYNSLFLAQAYGANVTGIDITRKHKVVAEELAAMLDVKAEFLIESAEEFERKDAFDLVLHFGTLYHLANPVRALEKSLRSLKPGGWFALETICYRGSPDRSICKWIHGLRGDRTNYWALGEGAIEEIAAYCGVGNIRVISESWPEAYKREMSRCMWAGQRSN